MLKKFKEHIKNILPLKHKIIVGVSGAADSICLLFSSDADDDLLCVDLGGRRIF